MELVLSNFEKHGFDIPFIVLESLFAWAIYSSEDCSVSLLQRGYHSARVNENHNQSCFEDAARKGFIEEKLELSLLKHLKQQVYLIPGLLNYY